MPPPLPPDPLRDPSLKPSLKPSRDPSLEPLLVDLPKGDPIAHAGVCRLFHTVFGHPIEAPTWVWKYHSAPGGQSINLVALDDAGWADPCGHVGCLVLPGRWQGRPAWMAHLTDVMVHPRARGGLDAGTVYGRLMREMAQRLAALAHVAAAPAAAPQPLFAYGFPGRTPSRLGQRMGLYRPIRADECQPEWLHHLAGIRPPGPFGRLLGSGPRVEPLGSSPAPGAATAAIPALAPTLEWVDRLPDHPDPEPTLVKSSAYLAWRYAQHPLRSYQLWKVSGRFNRAVGWLVTTTLPHAGDQGNPANRLTPLDIIDAHLSPAWSQGEGWDRVLAALYQVTGHPLWRSWRPGGTCTDTRTRTRTRTGTRTGTSTGNTTSQASPTLIVPGEFRVAELSGHPLKRPGRAPPHPAFHPGDTDVF